MDELNSGIEVTEEMDDNFPNLAKYIKPTDTRIWAISKYDKPKEIHIKTHHSWTSEN